MSYAETNLYNYLRVVHVPHQAPLLCVQYEVTTQELATALVLLYVQETADAVLSVHIRHLAAGTFPGLPGPGVDTNGRVGVWEWNLKERERKEQKERAVREGGNKLGISVVFVVMSCSFVPLPPYLVAVSLVSLPPGAH